MNNLALGYFKQITKIPRPSEKEGKIRDFLISWADEIGFENKADKSGNLFIYVPATPDKRDSDPLILQSHMDMVCVKTEDSAHDFDKDELDIFEEDGFLRAKDTTLGADNGVGIALSMAAAHFASHPELEMVFTADEERGMSGALNLDFSFLKSKQVLNLDSEDENEICISSAGGARISLKRSLDRKPSALRQYRLEISGMKGGHSGVDIDKRHSNSIKFLVDVLSGSETGFEIVSIRGGIADNVIPSGIEAVLGIADIGQFSTNMSTAIQNHKAIYDCPELDFSINEYDGNDDVIDKAAEVLAAISEVQVGVYSMSEKIPGLVQTSMNLGIIELGGDILNLTYLPRSSDMQELEDLLNKIKAHFERYDFDHEVHSKYPGWQDDPKGKLVDIASEEISEQIGKVPSIIAIHAGLECGVLVAGLGEGTHAISIGPNMYDVHSVKERVEIASINRFEKSLMGILSRL